jgi:hypothetical protein
VEGRGFITTAERVEKNVDGLDWIWWKRKTFMSML